MILYSIVIVVTIVLGAFGYYLYDLNDSKDRYNSQIITARNNLQRMTQLDTTALKKEEELLKYSIVPSKSLSEVEALEFMGTIVSAAQDSIVSIDGVTVTNTKEEILNVNYQLYRHIIQIYGTYDRLTNFLEALNLPSYNTVIMDKINVSYSKDDVNQWKMMLEFNVYTNN